MQLYILVFWVLYGFINIFVFTKYFSNAGIIVDEIFHVPQGLAYCKHNFTYYDPKLTTPPGLYLSAIFIPICSTYALRLTNVAFAIINFYLFYKVRQTWKTTDKEWSEGLHCLNIALTPILFFFSNLYYTDVPSLTTVLAVMYLGSHQKHFSLFWIGIYAFLMRQTNVLYIGLVGGIHLSGMVFNSIFFKNKIDELKELTIPQKELIVLVKRWKFATAQLLKLHSKVFFDAAVYVLLFMLFVMYLLWNQGIVLGDKSAHIVSVHTPQNLYFSVFTMFFAWPYFVPHIVPFMQFIYKNKYYAAMGVLLLIYEIFVHTTTHPYLLADNRHYAFYIWKYFLNTAIKRYAWIPVYYFAIYTILKKIYDSSDVRFCIFFIVITAGVITFQALFELRYFIPSYILLRLRFRNAKKWQLLAELVTSLLVNAGTIYVFVNKEIYWNDMEGRQHLIW